MQEYDVVNIYQLIQLKKFDFPREVMQCFLYEEQAGLNDTEFIKPVTIRQQNIK